MNILFTTSAAPLKSPFFTNEKRPPLGVGNLISLLQNEGHNVFFIDNYLNPSNFIEEGYLQQNRIDIVAIHTNTICYRDSLRMFFAIEDLRKRRLWNGKMVVGGPHTSVAVDTIPEFVDYIVQGEGEKAILQIVNSGVKERVIKQERIHDLDTLPFQPWDIFNSLPYDFSCPWLEVTPVFTMNTSRGCPFNCTFCSVSSIWGKQYTYLSADRIIAEIEYLVKKFGVKGIYFREDNFTLNSKRIEEFCEKLIRKHINITWACETRVDNISKELVEVMSTAGCRAFYFGVESGSQNILDMINKQITVEQIENAINWCKRYGVRSYCSLITGLPGETYEDYLVTKRLMETIKPYAHAFNIFVAIPDSSLYNHILNNKLYEYIDDIGLLYPPGYDIKTKYFYGRDNECFVDYPFKQRTMLDKQLMKELNRPKFLKSLTKLTDSVFNDVILKIRKMRAQS